ncbi:hypothetical protein SmJEL517_g01179 [Synchytrium microbalum]|uniref:Sodium/bile acid cotransporter 7 n=1 Tax=Synchytrium microbalum TaxID=1806994 RepID=A0A507C4X9_9FUNG|nr:uncharacterized protein SmJEL517_g01179 [Synchytrium microbalum]TPX36600.1 hypothetical protein SmJEL517_g01179 [Synchytrium microbalum]
MSSQPTTSSNTTAVSDSKPKRNRIKETWAWISAQWFLFALGASIGLAAAFPRLGQKGGYIRSEYSVHYGATGIIFLLSGLSLKTSVLGKTLLQWRTHLLIQLLSLGVFPAVGFAIGKILLALGYNQVLAHGLMIALATPTTIASNVTMTKKAGGNEPAALTNAVMGNIIGVFLSPVLIIAFTGGPSSGTSSSVQYGAIFLDLTYTVVIPLVIGQIIRFLFSDSVEWLQARIKFGMISSICLLLLVWAAFCDTFAGGSTSLVGGADMVVVILLNLVVFVSFSGVAFGISRVRWFGFTPADTVAIVMCAATKTVSLGVPLIQVIFANDPTKGILAIPLLMYHAIQLLIGAIFVTLFQKWIQKLSIKARDEEMNLKNVSLESVDDGVMGVDESSSGASRGEKKSSDEERNEISDVDLSESRSGSREGDRK